MHVIVNFESRDTTRWKCPDCKQEYPIKKTGGGGQCQIAPRVGGNWME